MPLSVIMQKVSGEIAREEEAVAGLTSLPTPASSAAEIRVASDVTNVAA